MLLKIKLGNVPKYAQPNTIRKFLATHLSLPETSVNARKLRPWNYCFVSVTAGPEGPTMEQLLNKLNGLQFKQQKLRAEEERYEPVPFGHNKDLERTLRDQVTPLWSLPYSEQLLFKQSQAEAILKKEFCNDSTTNNKGVWDEIVASPVTEGYRNKCEFTFGLGHTDKQPTLGFLLGAYRDGIVTVEHPADCPHVSQSFKDLTLTIQEFIRTPGNGTVYDRVTHTGLYRLLLVRQVGDALMVGLQVSPPAKSGLSEAQQNLILENFANLIHPSVGSFFVQCTEATHHGIDVKQKWRNVFGPETMTTKLGGLQFRVSLESFFQVNPSATPLLYSRIAEYATSSLVTDNANDNASNNSNANSTIALDICCGTGTIGLWIASSVKKVIGVELVSEAVQDAIHNRDLNGITNAEFLTGRAEDVLPKLLTNTELSSTPDQLVAVLDPPRAGIHPTVLKALSKLERLKALVFVSCDLGAVAKAGNNFKMLREKGWKLDRACVVDLFPHTNHYETVMKFVRHSHTSHKEAITKESTNETAQPSIE